MLAVDGHDKFPDRHRNVDGVYFNLNIKYPVEAAATLEFIQRYVSPDR